MNRKLQWVNADEPLPPTARALTVDEGANGLLAAGADLSPARLIEAYGRGIFPWFSRGEPVLWWTPSPRMVLMTGEMNLSASLRKSIRRFTKRPDARITCDLCFEAVMRACAAPRSDQTGTWISDPMILAYRDLHATGHAHSIEVWLDDELVAGLYCVSIGRMLFGESMFTRMPDASKMGLAALVHWARRHGAPMIDCQQRTAHLASLGAREIEREEFESAVAELTRLDALPWQDAPPGHHDLMDPSPCPT